MRKTIGLGLLALFVVGCSGAGIIPDSERDELIIKIAGRRIGAEIAENHVKIAIEIKRVAGDALVEDDAVVAIIELLVTSFSDDPMLRADILDVLAFVPIDPAVEEYASIAMLVINSIADGIVLWEGSQ